MMKAIQIIGDELVWDNVPEPDLKPGEILIANHATAVNRADLAQRSGHYPPPPGASDILGLECAGEVLAIGEGVSSYSKGDLVCALLAGGGYAERVAVPAGQVLPVPKGMPTATSAALPEAFATAWLNLFMEGGLKVGEKALLHAGASGVGTAAIQLCRANHVTCFVTLGDKTKLNRCLELGAQAGTVRHEEDFVDKINEWTAGQGVDVILDPVGASYLSANLKSLATNGRLVIIGLMGGSRADVNIGLMMMRRLRVIGSTLRSRSVAAKATVMEQLKSRVWPLLEQGSIKPVIETILPITKAAQAHELMASNQTVGKILLSISH